MINKLQKQGGRCSFKRSVMLLLMASLLVLAIPAISSAEETVPASAVAEEKQPSASGSPTTPCKGLKPYNNLDELLYQFYINLESDCLFEMPVEELEEIWGVKILTEERAKLKNYYPLSETEFYYKPYKTGKDAFFIEHFRYTGTTTVTFKLRMTKEFFKKNGTLYPEGGWAWLPESNVLHNTSLDSGHYPPLSRYAYASFDKARVILVNEFGEIELRKLVVSPEHAYANKNEPVALQDDLAHPATAKNNDAICRGLKPFDDIDDLLYQFYINLDSNCLFTMPIEELEEIWDTKILSDTRIKPFEGTYAQLRGVCDFYLKPYKSEKDAFFIEHSTLFNRKPAIFYIRITKEYNEKHNTLFPKGNLPKSLPEPIVDYTWRATPSMRCTWVSSDQARSIFFYESYYNITDITVRGW